MFTGIITGTGTITHTRPLGQSNEHGVALRVQAPAGYLDGAALGESIALNGACMTVTALPGGDAFEVEVSAESLACTCGLGAPGPVNLERALRAGDAMGGHIVQGHVDCRGAIAAKTPKGRDFQLKVRCGRVLASQSVLKGSIAIDGVSLTISGLGDDWLAVDLIPTTAKDTTLGSKKVGDMVNLEGDIVGKYVAKAAGQNIARH